MSRIAFAGRDGRIYVTEPDGSRQRPITPEGLSCAWPTWSPDGGSIAFSAHRMGSGNGHRLLAIYAANADGESPRQIYFNEPGTDAIAQGTPHYMLWSPDGARLGFIAQTWRGLTLLVSDLTRQDSPRRVLDGGPLYFSWSRDSRYLVAHSHQLHYLINAESMEAAQIPVAASDYMAPSWNPLANQVALFGGLEEDRQALLIADAEGGGARMLTEVEGPASFSWSPDGRRIALARDLDREAGYYGGLWSVNVDGSGEQPLTDDLLLCFFWSPDGGRIAYITPSEDAEGSIRWAVLDVQSGEVRYLSDFQPSREQLTMFMFFDQYGQSHSLWSPDGLQIMFSGILGYQIVRTQLPGPRETRVYVVDVGSDTPPVEVGEGSLAVWGPV